jgi:excisionase family DNA binding protein
MATRIGTAPAPRLRNVEQAAKELNIPKSTLQRLVTLKRVPFTQPGGLNIVRFSDKDMDDIIAAGRVDPEKDEPQVTRARKSRSAA